MVKERLGRCILLQFLFAIPGFLLMLMLYVPLSGRMMFGVNYAVSMNTVWLIVLVVLLVIGPLQYGMMRFYIRLQRGEDVSVGVLLQPFTSLQSFWAGVRMIFCRFCRYVIWLFVPIFVLSVASLFGVFTMIQEGRITQGDIIRFTLSVHLVIRVVLMPFFVKLMSYNAGWLELHDDETSSVWAVTRNGATLFRGHYGKLFAFELSFLGWYLLSAMTVFLMNFIVSYSGMMASATQEIVVSVVALIAGGFLQIVISGFLTAYHYTSFWTFCDILNQKLQPVEQGTSAV